MFSLTSSNIAQTQPRNAFARLNRRTSHSVKIIGGAVIALFASANSFAAAAENSSRMGQHACAVIMGLHQPGDLYDTCIRSLSKSLSALEQARSEDNDRSACAQSGHTPGTSAFAVCVVDAEQSRAHAPP